VSGAIDADGFRHSQWHHFGKSSVSPIAGGENIYHVTEIVDGHVFRFGHVLINRNGNVRLTSSLTLPSHEDDGPAPLDLHLSICHLGNRFVEPRAIRLAFFPRDHEKRVSWTSSPHAVCEQPIKPWKCIRLVTRSQYTTSETRALMISALVEFTPSLLTVAIMRYPRL